MENKNQKNGTYRWWLVTWNNPTNWKEALSSFEADYAKGQLEKGENGTPHLQAVLYYTISRRSTSFKGIPAWIKGCNKGDAEAILQYVGKEDTRIEGPIEYGRSPQSICKGKNWDEAKELAKKGAITQIQSSILIPYLGNLQKLCAIFAEDYSTSQTRGIWIYGQSGCGKSHLARTWFPSAYSKGCDLWFDGYSGESTILIDDFDKFGIAITRNIKIWADKYPCTGAVKGASTKLRHDNFVITSQYLPDQIWQDAETLEAIYRRFVVYLMANQRILEIHYKFIVDS